MKVYVAGPMTGYVEHNFPAFKAAAARLRSLGYQVVNPAELDEPLGLSHEELSDLPHEFFLRRDIEALLDCDGIYTLPGWRYSKGATLEVAVAKGCGILRVKDHDLDLWRTFEGEPLTEPSTEEPEEGIYTLPPGFRPDSSILLCGSVTTENATIDPDNGVRLVGQDNVIHFPADAAVPAHFDPLPDAKADGYEWPPLCKEQTCPKHGEANRQAAEDEVDHAEVIRLHTTRPEVEVPLWARGHSVPQPGDRFPDVAYVRDMTGRTSAELAEIARSHLSEQFERGEN